MFLVYQDFNANERNNGSWHGTQAAADAAATVSGSGFTAHQGAVEVPQGWETGWIYHPTNGTWRQLDVSDLDDPDTRRYAARGLQLALDAMNEAAGGMSSWKPRRDVQRVLTILAMARWANYVVFQNANGAWTSAQQIAWAGAMADGALDATDTQALYQRAHFLRDDAVPAEACAWADPADASAVNLQDARAQSAVWFGREETDLTRIELGNGAWIEDIT